MLSYEEIKVYNCDWDKISSEAELSVELLQRDYRWNWKLISSNPSITFDIVEEFYDDIDWHSLSSNPAINLLILERFQYKLNWGRISMNSSLTPEMIELFPDKDWEWGHLGTSAIIGISIDFINRFPEKEWHWGYFGLSMHLDLSNLIVIYDDIKDKLVWGRNGISRNRSLTSNIIDHFYNKPFHFGLGGVSSNLGISVNMIKKYKNKLDWDTLRYYNHTVTPEMLSIIEDRP